MKNFIRFTDTIQAEANLAKGISGKQFIKTKDSTSASGHSLVTQIEMTHSGIVTRNLGFYLPDNMAAGAHTFVKNYKKPVLVGHDADSDPVGRVIASKYADTSATIRHNDKFLSNLYQFVDKKKGKNNKETLTDFVQYVINEYYGKDSYRGLGHILGTLKITDEETIAKILDERYLTVSTAMISDAARCSECGQDWINEGMCDHKRGQTYDSGVPMVIIPGSQSYDHVGIVSEPADVFAAGFKTVELFKDGLGKDISEKIDTAYKDKFSIAAHLFSHSDSKLVSLSDDLQTDLIEVKNNIQEIEDSLKTENTAMKLADQISATISLWSSEGEGEDYKSTSIELRKYVKALTTEEIAKLAQQALQAMDSKEFKSESEFQDALKTFIEGHMPADEPSTVAVIADSTQEGNSNLKAIKVLDGFTVKDGEGYEASLEETTLEEINKLTDATLTKKDAKELARIIVRSQKGDVLSKLTLDATGKDVATCVTEFNAIKEKRFTLKDKTDKEVLALMNDELADDLKITDEAFEQLDSKSCAGSSKYFPITSKETAVAAKKVLGLLNTTDSLKGRILGNIERLASTFTDTTEEVITTTPVAENLDTASTGCNNQDELSDEKLLESVKTLLDQAEERDLLDKIISVHLDEKQHEIEILEQQLELANEEVAKLEGEISTLRDSAKKELAEKVVDAKIKAGHLIATDRESELANHLARTEDSLKDAMNDLSKIPAVDLKKISHEKKIESPVLQDAATSLNEQLVTEVKFDDKAHEEKKIKETQKKYQLLRASKGKAFADQWLKNNA
ncbi:MAG: hypothetical protein PHY47_00445 [Lachnospiraceae bacterium]|nr:hypothetical protein [Lachnospiraceae bacterium]